MRFDEHLHLLDKPLRKPLSEGGYMPGAAPQLSITPLIAQTGKDNLSAVMNRLPKQASVDLSGYRQAGKWNVTFDYRDFPIDPRLCRAVLVEIHFGCVESADFADGMVRTRTGGGRKSILQTRYQAGKIRTETLTIMGLADNIHAEWSDKGAWLRMEGRDFRGIMLDAAARPSLLAKLKLRQPIHEVVKQIISLHPFGVGITVAVNDDDWPNSEIPSPADAQGLTRVNMGATGVTPIMPMRGDPSQLSIWDIITNYCTIVGAVPYFVGQVLYIRPARSLYSRFKTNVLGDPAVPTPFQGGEVRIVRTQDSTEKLTIRRLVFGNDISSLEFERKLGGIKVPQVEIVSHNTSSTTRGLGRLLIARFPSDNFIDTGDPAAVDDVSTTPLSDTVNEAAKVTSVMPGGQTHRQILRMSYPGIQSQAVLNRIARELWEEIGRGEMGGKVSTKNLATFGGTNQDPDILSLKPGDPVEIVMDARALSSQPPLAHDVVDHHRRSFEDEVADVAQRVGDQNLARVLVATARNQVQELQTFFRVNNVHFGWDVESGVEMQFDFQNFLEARYDIDKQKENQRSTRRSTVAGPK